MFRPVLSPPDVRSQCDALTSGKGDIHLQAAPLTGKKLILLKHYTQYTAGMKGEGECCYIQGICLKI